MEVVTGKVNLLGLERKNLAQEDEKTEENSNGFMREERHSDDRRDNNRNDRGNDRRGNNNRRFHNNRNNKYRGNDRRYDNRNNNQGSSILKSIFKIFK